MDNINRVIEGMPLVIARAKQLRCKVVAVTGNVILCHRDDDTCITWKCYIQLNEHDGLHYAIFDSGHYDLTQEQGRNSLLARARWTD